MRLWHQTLIPYLPRQQLLGQHRECCALRGKGWGKKHSVVDYVFKYHHYYLVAYHHLVMNEMKKRGYNVDKIWYLDSHRGKNIPCHIHTCSTAVRCTVENGQIIYPEHNDKYLQECLNNLKDKGIEIKIDKIKQ